MLKGHTSGGEREERASENKQVRGSCKEGQVVAECCILKDEEGGLVISRP